MDGVVVVHKCYISLTATKHTKEEITCHDRRDQKGVKTKRVSVKDRMREALEEARAEADIKPIKRASKGATSLKSSL